MNGSTDASSTGESTALSSPSTLSSQRHLMKTYARSFSWAALFLSGPRRRDVETIYAFCKFVDDLGRAPKEASEPNKGRDALLKVRDQLRGESQSPFEPVYAYMSVAQRHDVPVEAAEHYVEGVIAHRERTTIPDDATLLRHCYEAAGTVALMIAPVLGVEDERARPHAIDLGIAMQLTKLCRDVDVEAERDRCLLPVTRLADYGVTPEQVIDGSASRRAVRRVVYDLLALARRYYTSGEQGMRFLPIRNRIAIFSAVRLHRAIGRQLAKLGYDPFAGRAAVSALGTLFCMIRAVVVCAVTAVTRRSHYLPHKQWLHRRINGLPGANGFDEHETTPEPDNAYA